MADTDKPKSEEEKASKKKIIAIVIGIAVVVAVVLLVVYRDEVKTKVSGFTLKQEKSHSQSNTGDFSVSKEFDNLRQAQKENLRNLEKF